MYQVTGVLIWENHKPFLVDWAGFMDLFLFHNCFPFLLAIIICIYACISIFVLCNWEEQLIELETS